MAKPLPKGDSVAASNRMERIIKERLFKLGIFLLLMFRFVLRVPVRD